jgi:predicted ATP-dependent serine protease
MRNKMGLNFCKHCGIEDYASNGTCKHCGAPASSTNVIEKTEKETSLKNDSLEELFVKQMLLKTIISENEDDPRVGEPKRQLVIINAEIKRREENEKPPDLTVGLKSLNLKVKRT